MSFSFWSDEDRLFVPRMLGWSINFKFIANTAVHGAAYMQQAVNEHVTPGDRAGFIDFDETAVMVDTFRPLKVTQQALDLEIEGYHQSWL